MKKTNFELLKLNPIELGLSIEQVEEIKKPFQENANKLMELQEQANEVGEIKEITKETCKKARELRLTIAKIRTWTEEVKDNEKADILKKWSAIQFCYNLIKEVAKQEEEKLEKIEKHFENLEKERVAKLQTERLEQVKPFMDSFALQWLSLWTMSDEVFEAFLQGAKSKFEQKKAQEEKEAKEKAEKEAKEKAERERIAAENEKLKKQNEKKDEKFKKEREAKEKAEKEARELKEKAEREAKEKADKEAQEKADQERLEKAWKYKKFLEKNGVSPENEKDFIIKKEDGVVRLYKLVDTFTI